MLRKWGKRNAAPIATFPHSAPAAASARIAVVTVAYASAAVLPALARDLAAQSSPPDLWLLVDNSPQSAPLDPDLLTTAATAGLKLRAIGGDEGAGFAAGCNRALDLLAEEHWDGWVWLLNPDTGLPIGDELACLRAQLQQLPAQALVGTAVADGNGGYEANGGWFSAGLAFRGRRLDPRAALQDATTAPLALDWLSGCSLALRPAAQPIAARFDEHFPLYYEDMDLCRRLARQGAPVLWLRQPLIVHRKGSGSLAPGPRRLQLSTLSYLRFLRRYSPGWVVALRSLRLLLLSLLRLPLRPRCSLAVLKAMLTVLREPT
jgi:N-acetylglucosaminyl-diphospho-decaprenol L-rhamnosyltransferase